MVGDVKNSFQTICRTASMIGRHYPDGYLSPETISIRFPDVQISSKHFV